MTVPRWQGKTEREINNKRRRYIRGDMKAEEEPGKRAKTRQSLAVNLQGITGRKTK